MSLYGDVMTQADPTSRRIGAAVSALWSAPAWRATGNAPRQIAYAFRTTISASAPLAGIVRLACPAEYSTVSPSGWKRLVPDEATDLWRSACLRAWLPDDQYELARLENPVPLLRRQHAQLIAALAGTIPAATFRPGADSAAALGHVVMSLRG
jgi:hypothetical protein